MHPLQLKDLVEENYELKEELSEMRIANETLEGIIEFKTQLLAQQEVQKKQATERADSELSPGVREGLAQGMGRPEAMSKYDWAVDENGRFYIKGVIFKVQIGAYKQRDLHLMLEEADDQEIFVQEQSGGLNRYTLMRFRDYWQANQFKKELRAMGLKDAFIVAFQDGKRVPLKAVLPEIIQQKSK